MILRNYDERIVIGNALCRHGMAVKILKRGFMDVYHGKLRSAHQSMEHTFDTREKDA
jgi:hypothetical protein